MAVMKGGWPKIGWIILAALVIGLAGWQLTRGTTQPSETMLPVSAKYESLLVGKRVTEIATGLGQVTRIGLTPDDQVMLATTLTGDVWALTRTST